MVFRQAEAPPVPSGPESGPAVDPGATVPGAGSGGSAEGTAVPVAAGTPAVEAGRPTPSPTDLDALLRRLNDPLVDQLKAELRLDRERVGHGLDLRH
jgi:hypothetical protein